MIGLFVLLAVSLTLAALYITGVIRPPLLAKALASCAFAAVGAWALFVLPLTGGGGFSGGNAGAVSGGDAAAATGITTFRLLIFIGLAAGVAGDVLLELFGQEDKRFFLGVAAFFAGHALYVAAFFTVDASAALTALLCAFPVAALLTAISARFLTFKGAQRLILLVYLFALCFMCAFAWVILIRRGTVPFALLAPGALLFLLSDTSLGFMLFGSETVKRRTKLLGVICLTTYYLAQNLIALSIAF